MNTELTVGGVTVAVTRKPIRSFNLGVYPPDGRVRLSVPMHTSDDAVRLAIIDKLGWIKKQRERHRQQPRQVPRLLASGESHYYLGQRYRLRVIEQRGPAGVVLPDKQTMVLTVPSGATEARRRAVVNAWYRARLRELLPPLLAQWQARLGVAAAAWGIKRMRTRWGTCNPRARRVWFNLELAKKSRQCLEYIVVHELLHLIERRHDARFRALLDTHLPVWRQYRDELNTAPLAHEQWQY